MTSVLKLGDRVKFVLVMTPLFVGVVLGYTTQIPLNDVKILSIGIPLLAGAFVFSTLSHKMTKFIVGKHGYDKEINPIARASLMRGTADRDHRRRWIGLLAIASFEYLLVPKVWVFLIAGGFGTMFLDWLNDYLVLRRKAVIEPLPNLDWALEPNSELRRTVYSAYSFNAGYLRYVDKLIATLRSRSVKGIQEKMADVSDLAKFHSTVSELEIARILCSKYPSELLSDNAWRGQSPDIVVKRNAREILVEVKRLTEDESEKLIVNELRRFLANQESEPVIRVDVELKDSLALPVVKRPERIAKEEIAKRSIDEFKSKFGEAARRALPTDVHTEGAIFSLNSASAGKESHLGVISTHVVRVPEDLLIAKLVDDVCEKAGKRNSFPPEKKDNPYVVAIDSEQISVDDITLERAFIGDAVYLMPPIPIPNEPLSSEVVKASSRSWKSFLEKTAIIPSGRSYLPREKRGAFFTRQELRNVSLIMIRTAASHYFLPNPFSDDSINDSSLTSFV